MSTHLVALLVALLTATAASAPIVVPAQPSLKYCKILSDQYGLYIRVANDGGVMAKEGVENTKFVLRFNGKTVQIESKDRSGSFIVLNSNVANGTSNSTANEREIEVGVPTPATMNTTIWTMNPTPNDYNGRISLSQKTEGGDCYAEFGQDGAMCGDVPGDNTKISLLCD